MGRSELSIDRLEKNREYHKQYYQENKEKWRISWTNLPPKKRELKRLQSKLCHVKRKQTDPNYMKNRQKRANKNDKLLKIEVLLHYSPKNSIKPNCCCCGENILEFLTLDHKKPIGSKNRVWGSNQYRKVRMLGFPKGYQTLCINCNFGRQINGGVCPHGRW